MISFVCVENTFKCNNTSGHIFKMHNRPTNAIVLVEQGEYIYTSKKNKILSDPNHVIFLPKGSCYQLKCLKSDCSRIIQFSGDLKTVDPYSVEIKNYQELIDIFDSMATEQSSYLINSQLYYLLYLLIDQSQTVPPLLKEPVDYIKRHYSDFNIKNDKLAEMSNISTVYFRKLFAAYYGVSPQCYIKDLRIKKAKQLLKLREHSTSEIAVMCGYENIYSFSSAFKKSVGICPSAYIRQFKII